MVGLNQELPCAPTRAAGRPLRHGLLAVGLLAVAAVLLLLAGRPAQAQVFAPEQHTLDNGMQVVVLPMPAMPAVHHMVWYRVGAADEDPGQTGVAHLLEHLMFKGTARHPGETFSRTVEGLGGENNAFTGRDFTAYYQTVPPDALETVMALEADRMNNLTLTPEEVLTERDVVLEERRSRVDNKPAALLNERADAAFYRVYPYRNPIIGWPAQVAALTEVEVSNYYQKWYSPNNAILVVAGPVTGDRVLELARTYYAPLESEAVPERLRPAEPRHLTANTVTLRHPQVGQPQWYRKWAAPSYGTTEPLNAEALEVLAGILGETTNSRLYRTLVVEDQLAVSAGAYYRPQAMGPAAFTVYATPREGVSLDQIEAAVTALIAEVVAEGVTVDEVTRTRDRLLAQAAYARDSLTHGPYLVGEVLAMDLPVSLVEEWPERMVQITPSDVTDAARRVLDTDAHLTARLMRPRPTRVMADTETTPEARDAAEAGETPPAVLPAAATATLEEDLDQKGPQ